MAQLLRVFYHLWYFRSPPWDTGISPPELLAFIDSHPPGRALDLGCGTGTNLITLARNGWQATGVDFAPRAISLAHRKARQAGIEIQLLNEDVTRLSGLRGRYDLILDMGCFHSLPNGTRQAYLNNLDRLLAPNGTFMLYVFFKEEENAPGPGISEADIQALSANLAIIKRQDGSERGIRRSAWFWFQRQPRADDRRE